VRNAECGTQKQEHHAEEGRSRVISIGKKSCRVEVLPIRAALLAALSAALLAALRTIALVALLALILVAAGALFRALPTLLLLVALLLVALLLVAALPLLIAGVLVRVLVIHICSSRESAERCRMQACVQRGN
jgi:hypothetical protein